MYTSDKAPGFPGIDHYVSTGTCTAYAVRP